MKKRKAFSGLLEDLGGVGGGKFEVFKFSADLGTAGELGACSK